MGLTVIRKVIERPPIEGVLRAYDRPAGSRIWRPAGEWKNIVLNQFYIDLFSLMSSGPNILNIGALALGVKASPAFARTDTGLTKEWQNPVALLTTQINNGATGVTSLACTGGVKGAIATGTNILLDAGQTVVTNGATADGATSITVNSFTASQLYAVNTTISVSDWTPQRMSVTLATPTNTDPPLNVWSFYLAAAANVANVVFTEAGLLYNSPSLVAGGAGSWATHVAFAYTKLVTTDLRLDYTLQRTNT
jgi:hypothetical protein